MSIFTIGDLHLSFKENKPMDIFGENWKNHEEQIKNNWIQNVKQEDLVILPGDFSWATYLKDTYLDFEYLNNLPGKKLLLKGNHDYWWTTLTSMRKFLEENNFSNIDFIYNNSYKYEDYIISGTRGWGAIENEADKKMINREEQRLELSIQDGINKYGDDKEIIVFMHYPPITNIQIMNNEMNGFVKIMKKYNIKKCYYAHLHSIAIKDAVAGEHFGIEFKLVSADGIGFKLLKVI